MKKFLAFLIVAGLVIFGFVACTAAFTPDDEPTATVTDVQRPKTEPEPEPKEDLPKESVSQEQAVQSAESYISMGGMSKSGLVGQLEFEGFSNADATYAVEKLNPDFDKAAVQSAESYMEMGGFSAESLTEQLVFEGFTQSQAENAVKAVGF